MTKKIAFITGANRGIGLETARQLGKLGILPILGTRNIEQGKAAVAKLLAEGIEAEAIPYDSLDKKTHTAAFDYFSKKFGKLDILVNNAGINLEGDLTKELPLTSKTSEETLRKTLDANFFAVVATTQTLLPLLRKSTAARIVNVSSGLGSLTLHADKNSPSYGFKIFAYDTSKTALNSFTIHLAAELKDTPIKVNSIHPGWVKTDMGGEQAPLSIEEGAVTSVRLATIPDNGPTGKFFFKDDELPW